MPFVSEAHARKLAVEILKGAGAQSDHAAVVGNHLVDANLAGHDSHGLVRLPQYAEHVSEGKINPAGVITLAVDAGPFALVDANWCWGQVAAARAVEETRQRVKAHGIACVGLRQAPHIGRVGVYPKELAQEGFIAQAWCNCGGAVRVAPWGGTDARLATNPIAIAFPTSGEPILLDITTSVVAEGKVRIARNAKKQVPPGWILNKQGKSTTEPADLYDGGTILPLGGEAFGHKGFALAMMCDLFAGVLTGAGCGKMPGVPLGNGLLLLAFDPRRIDPKGESMCSLDQYMEYLRSTPKSAGTEEILLPGEPEVRTARKRQAEGIPVDDGTWAELDRLARAQGISLPTTSDVPHR